MMPTGARVSAPTPLSAAMNRNLPHMAARMSRGISDTTPRVLANAARSASARSLGGSGQRPEGDVRLGARVPDMPRGQHVADDAAESTEHVLRTEGRGQPVGGLDAILQRNHDGIPTDERPHALRGVRNLPGLDADQHDVDRAQRRRIVGGGRRLDHEVAGDARHPKAARADGRQVLSPGDEGHVLAGLGQPPAEVASHCAGSEDRDAHAAFQRWDGSMADADERKVSNPTSKRRVEATRPRLNYGCGRRVGRKCDVEARSSGDLPLPPPDRVLRNCSARSGFGAAVTASSPRITQHRSMPIARAEARSRVIGMRRACSVTGPATG